MIYGNFSKVYDMFMDNVDYDKWADYIEEIFLKYGKKPSLILELACGTASLTYRLAKKGYDMIALDISTEMLMEAREKCEDLGILFLNQDMRSFELYGTVDVCICPMDGYNYLLEKEDILASFKLVNNYLNPGGIFIFDMNTKYKFEEILGNNTFSQTEENAAFIWENYYDSQTKINEYAVNFFLEDEETGLYERSEEIHYQKAYETQEIIELINQSGLEFIEVFHELSFCEPDEKSEKLFFVAREKGKGKN